MFRSLAVIQTASAALLRSIHRRRLARRLVSFAIILNLFIWPAPGITLKSFEPASALASTVSSTVIAEASLAFSELREMPVVFVPLGPILFPLPVFPLWPFRSTGVARDLTMAERTARVSSISVSPQKYVSYIGALALLEKLENEHIKLGDANDPVFKITGSSYSPAYTQGTGESAMIVLDPGVNTPDLYRVGFYGFMGGSIATSLGLTSAEGIALGLLHELSHATGRYVHPGDRKPSDKTEVKTQDEIMQGLYENCFKKEKKKK